MPYAVTHFLIPVILLELFRDFFIKDKKLFPIYYILIGGLAGLLPDIDYIFTLFYKIPIDHRLFFHNLYILLIFLILGFIFYNYNPSFLAKKHLKLRNIFFIITFSTFIHLILDFIVWGTIMPFYPLTTIGGGLNLIQYLPPKLSENFPAILDAFLLTIWATYIVINHKLSEFL